MKTGMKRFLSAVLLLLSVLGAGSMLSVSALAAGESGGVYDLASLLGTDAEAEMISRIEAFYSATEGCRAYVVTYDSQRGHAGREYWGEEFLAEYGIDERTPTVLLIISKDRGEYFYNLYTYGNATGRIPSKEVDYLLDTDAVYDNLKTGKLREGTLAFLATAETAYNGRLGASYAVIAVVCGVISLLVGFFVCLGVWSRYKQKMRSVDYPLDRFAKLELLEDKDVFKGSFVTKRVISSGGSGGGGGSSHGGGGGHRGGR